MWRTSPIFHLILCTSLLNDSLVTNIIETRLHFIVHLPTSDKSLLYYRLLSDESISMFTGLITHSIHPYACFTLTMDSNRTAETSHGTHFLSRYSAAQNLVLSFLPLFFRSCGMKQGEGDYRLLFDNFLTALLITVNRPEWFA